MGRRHKNTYIFAPRKTSHPVRTFFLWLLTLVLLGALTVFILNLATNSQVEYLTQRITVETLPNDLESFSILHLSDLHAAHLGRDGSALQKVVTKRNVSCIVLTGDMVGESGDTEPLLQLLDMLPKDVSVYIIAGDSDPSPLNPTAHDSVSPYADWLEAAVAHGAIYLDEPEAQVRGKSTLWLVPEYLYSLDLDSTEAAYQAQHDALSQPDVILSPDQAAQLRVADYQLAKLTSIREKLQTIKDEDIQVAVSHTPLTRDYVTTMMAWTEKTQTFSFHHVSLILAGHYCGGQWRLPGGGALYCPAYGWFPEDQLITGLDYLNGIPQYISPGLGASPYYSYQPGRLFNSPAMTYLQLTSRIN